MSEEQQDIQGMDSAILYVWPRLNLPASPGPVHEMPCVCVSHDLIKVCH